MTNLIERLKGTNYKKWYIFAHKGMHALEKMEERKLKFKDVKEIIKRGELLPNADPNVVLCVGKKNRKFFTLVMKPLFEGNSLMLITIKPTNEYQKRMYKKKKRLRK